MGKLNLLKAIIYKNLKTWWTIYMTKQDFYRKAQQSEVNFAGIFIDTNITTLILLVSDYFNVTSWLEKNTFNVLQVCYFRWSRLNNGWQLNEICIGKLNCHWLSVNMFDINLLFCHAIQFSFVIKTYHFLRPYFINYRAYILNVEYLEE